MEDEAKARGIETDYRKLEKMLGIQVIGTVAPQRKGISKLRDSLLLAKKPAITLDYGK
jgi:Fe2+ transport system protein B